MSGGGVRKLRVFNDLASRVVRDRVDMLQLWEAWIEADDRRRHSFRGSLHWEVRSGREYLYSRKGRVAKSLGPRSPDTEQIYQAFREGKAEVEVRLGRLTAEMERLAAVLRAEGAGRLPRMAAQTLRALRRHDKQATIRVVGTNALYAYEALAGVVFDSAATATGDFDILVDDRKRLRLLTETDDRIGLTRLIQSEVDRTFKPFGVRPYGLANDAGYRIEFIRPEPKLSYRQMPGGEPLEAEDVEPAAIHGLQWLVNSPVVETVVIDERGFPAPIRCPDPRYWAAHKLWLAAQDNRDPFKKGRDRQQADVLFQLLWERLPQFPLDDAFRSALPKVLRAQLPEDPAPARAAPSW